MSFAGRARRPLRSIDAETRVLTKAVARTAERLKLTNAVLGRCLGVSEATASRLRSGKYTLDRNGKEFELAAFLVRIFRGCDALFGGDEEAVNSWLRADNTALRGQPHELIQTIQGMAAVVIYVDARRARI
jgi:hypothetical protein